MRLRARWTAAVLTVHGSVLTAGHHLQSLLLCGVRVVWWHTLESHSLYPVTSLAGLPSLLSILCDASLILSRTVQQYCISVTHSTTNWSPGKLRTRREIQTELSCTALYSHCCGLCSAVQPPVIKLFVTKLEMNTEVCVSAFSNAMTVVAECKGRYRC